MPLPSTSKGIFIFDPAQLGDDRMQQWTITLERELMRNTSLHLTYIGTHGSNLEQRIALIVRRRRSTRNVDGLGRGARRSRCG